MKEYNIAHFGAFDIDSFGDSLFAEIFRNEISKRIHINNITLFSVTERENAYNNNGHIYSYEQFEEMNENIRFDAIVIGGGEMFHFKPITFKGKKDEEKLVYPPGYLWSTPIQKGKENNIPVYFNGLGVPYSFNQNEHKILEEYLPSISYISVRDQYSKNRLCENIMNDECVECVPDSILLIDKYYNSNKLSFINKNICEKFELNEPYIVFQYGTTYKLEEIAQQLVKIKHDYKYNIALIPINYCHEDLVAAEKIKELLTNDVVLIDEKLSTDEIISIIAYANIFIGTSLHGNLVASVYGVKTIALDMYKSFVSKLDGLFDTLGLENSIIPEPQGIYSKFSEVVSNKNENLTDKEIENLQKKVENHFDEIASIIEGKKKMNKIDLIQQHFDGVLENKSDKYIKSYIYDKLDDSYILSIAVNENGTYTFVFTFKSEVDLKNLEWDVFFDYPIKIKIVKCSTDENEVNITPINRFKNEGCHDIFTDSNVRYMFVENYNCNNIKIECEVLKFSDDENIQLLRDSNNNKLAHIELLLQSERELQSEKEELQSEKEELQSEKEELQSEKEELQNKLSYLETNLDNKNGHIQLLLESDRELQRIKSSRSWRFMGYVWKIRDGLVPSGSRRRLLCKLTIKFIKHPIRFVKKLTPSRIRKFFYYLKREGVSNVSSRLDECVIGDSNIDIRLNLIDIIEKESYDISDFKKLVFPMVEEPKVSIIIPVYNEIKYTYACLQSILKNSKDVEYEIIIANDCSTDITSEIHKFVENINLITTEKNLRFLLNCNNAAKYARGEYILFLNNDTQVQENWLKPLVDLIEKDSSIGMVGSKLVYPNGRLQEAGGIIWDDASGWNYGRLSDPNDSEFSYVKECDYISGAAIMIRHNLWKEIGGFDERYVPAYYEDSDLAFEVRKHGYKVMLQPLSIVVHFEGISNGTDLTSGQKAYQVKNCETFKEKWKDELQKQFKNAENVFVARDRSKNKKHILVVDHYVPQYDKDAGSRTIYQYLNLFVKMGYGVSFIGDNFYQHEPYTTDLQQIGVEVLYGSYYSNNWKNWIKENSEYFDFVFLNRPHISEKYIDFLKENTKAKIVYYGHDLHFLREMREFELTGDNVILKSSEEWKKKELDLMNKADTILYPSDVEVSEIKKINNSFDVRRLPAYIMENSKKLREINERKDLLFVGGFGHGPNVDGIVWFCENIFPIIIEKNPKIKLNIVGSKVPDKVLALKSDNINVLGFVSDEKLAELYKDCRVSVAPLRYGAGIKGKIIEAIANGIPVVTTTCGAEGIANDNNFIIVEDDCEKFAQNILKLYDDEELIKSNIDKGFNFIENYYSSDSAENFIRELFIK